MRWCKRRPAKPRTLPTPMSMPMRPRGARAVLLLPLVVSFAAYFAAFIAAFFALSACSNLGQAVLDVGRVAWRSGQPQGFAHIALDPRLVYLEVHAPKASALMVLAYAEGQPMVETWMSADREVFRTEQGRFRGAKGVPGLWADVLWGLPESPTAQSPMANPSPPQVAVRDPALGLYTPPAACQPLAAQPPQNPSPLLRRVLAAHGPLQWQACQAKLAGAPALYSVVAYLPASTANPSNPTNSASPAPTWVYGQHCVGGQVLRTHCVEYWRRTAAGGA